MAEDSIIKDDKKIYDLTEVYEERNGRNNQEVIIVDGRGYERIVKDNKYIHELVDIAEDQSTGNNLNEEILKRVTDIAERIAREIIPEIAERVIREEIDKLKKMSGNGSTMVN
ncbi:MAG: hypothetical protein CVU52_04205 [Deltaproteobacteria bacterium HGW-Deltaproteobacteria-10]|nr:MAG: hypothetical protein CVU52_04205 [Deltaproteobacteria bacterium HGW-Deltaproteobacteria-10]